MLSRTPMDLPRDLIELFSAFASAGVRYLLVGGHAVAAHGRPRSTKDVDLWLAPNVSLVSGTAVVSLTADDATGFTGVPPDDTGGAGGAGGSNAGGSTASGAGGTSASGVGRRAGRTGCSIGRRWMRLSRSGRQHW
jgi:hypothetical protein